MSPLRGVLESLVKQRVMGLCLGYEDLDDHDELCRDRMMVLLCERDVQYLLDGEGSRHSQGRRPKLAAKPQDAKRIAPGAAARC